MAHRLSGGGKGGTLAHGIGRYKGGRTIKIHLVTDARGRPCVMAISHGNIGDYRFPHQCLAAIPPAREPIADKGYDSDTLRQWLSVAV